MPSWIYYLRIVALVGAVSAALPVMCDLPTIQSNLVEIGLEERSDGDHFGSSIAAFGNKCIVGAFGYGGGYNDPLSGQGAAFILDIPSGQIDRPLFASDRSTGDFYGNAVAISSTHAAVGAFTEDAGEHVNHNCGSVYVYDLSDGAEVFKISPEELDSSAWFGTSVAINENYIVAGAPNQDSGEIYDAGVVFVFDASNGAFIRRINAPIPEVGADFGYSVSLHGDTLAVGERLRDGHGGRAAGAAYLFDLESGNLISELEPPALDGDDWFGYSVSAGGDYVVVGSPRSFDSCKIQTGLAFLFDARTGEFIDILESRSSREYDWFGVSVAQNTENLTIIGADLADGAQTQFDNPDFGEAHIFDLDARVHLSRAIKEDADFDDEMGNAVAITEDAFLVCAMDEDDERGFHANRGVVYRGDTPPTLNPSQAEPPLTNSMASMILHARSKIRKLNKQIRRAKKSGKKRKARFLKKKLRKWKGRVGG